MAFKPVGKWKTEFYGRPFTSGQGNRNFRQFRAFPLYKSVRSDCYRTAFIFIVEIFSYFISVKSIGECMTVFFETFNFIVCQACSEGYYQIIITYFFRRRTVSFIGFIRDASINWVYFFYLTLYKFRFVMFKEFFKHKFKIVGRIMSIKYLDRNIRNEVNVIFTIDHRDFHIVFGLLSNKSCNRQTCEITA